ncbi:MAG: hypothetical protein KJZ84_19795 [Bryobacteraceae bacterium]|nr:hypothetical protein [Bryobacteraceae bacterium]
MFTGIILTRGALEAADEVWRDLGLDEEGGELARPCQDDNHDEQIEFAVLLQEAALAQRNTASA